MQTLRKFLEEQSGQRVGLFFPEPDSYSGELVESYSLSDDDWSLTCEAVVVWVESYVSEHPDIRRVRRRQYGHSIVCYRNEEGDTDTKVSVSQGLRGTIGIIITEEPVRPQ